MSTAAAANEWQRIRDHLREVERRLRAASTEGWPPARAAARTRSLDALRQYREVGVFPENHAPGVPRSVPVPGGFDAEPDSSPVFIDERGVPCAVGQLVIASGRRDVAEEVARTSNRAWLLDMHQPALREWVAHSGFSAIELAAVQPTYAFVPTEIPAYMGACPPAALAGASARGLFSDAYVTCLDDRLRHATSAAERVAIAELLVSEGPAQSPTPRRWEPTVRRLLDLDGSGPAPEGAMDILRLYIGFLGQTGESRGADLAKVADQARGRYAGDPAYSKLSNDIARATRVSHAASGSGPRRNTDPIPELVGGAVGTITCTVNGETVAWFDAAQRADLAFCGATLPPPPSLVHVSWTVQPDGSLLSTARVSCFGRVSEHWTLPGQTGTIVCAIPFEGAEAP